MKISTKGRYAVRCMLNLAIHGGEPSVPVSRISKEEDISANYIEQLFLKLKKAGLVESVRGRSGGYRLLKEPEEITAAGIIEAVEGPIVTVDCVREGNCERYDACTTKYLWEVLSKKIEEVLGNTTLKDLCDTARDKMGGDLEHRLSFDI
ncbi:MAG: RrF2 family transcriptional regulator [Elusimicrobiota bacterium]